MSTVKQIPVERLWELYDYNPLTGQIWSKYKKTYFEGRLSGNRRGFQINILSNGKRFTANYGAVVYAWCKGEWAQPSIDHIDKNFRNNRLSNLRPADPRLQSQNRRNFKGGAIHYPTRDNWRSQIVYKGRTINLSYFASAEEARSAYKAALELIECPMTDWTPKALREAIRARLASESV